MAHVTTFCVRKVTFFCNEFHVACICFVTIISIFLSKLNTLHEEKNISNEAWNDLKFVFQVSFNYAHIYMDGIFMDF